MRSRFLGLTVANRYHFLCVVDWKDFKFGKDSLPLFRDAWLGVLGLRELKPEECEVHARLNKNRHLERVSDNVGDVAV